MISTARQSAFASGLGREPNPVAWHYCGRDQISWNKFPIAVELFVEVETATHRLSEVMMKQDSAALPCSWLV